jgi:hypothetical protein
LFAWFFVTAVCYRSNQTYGLSAYHCLPFCLKSFRMFDSRFTISERSSAMESPCPSALEVPGPRPLRGMAYFVPLIWVAAVVAGLAALQEYKSRPGSTGRTPSVLPNEHQLQSAGRARLMMFVHPKCPCSRASLGELAEIAARESSKVAVDVVFVKPPGAGDDWAKSSLRDLAAQIPGARLVDDDGTLARRFGAETSGYVVLYDADGKLLFSGGITRSRGHEGESPGRQAICALLDGNSDTAAEAKTPVYGCPLFSPGQCTEPKGSADGNGKLP